MSLTITDAIRQRTSVSKYRSGQSLSRETLERLIELATLSPSAYNLQNWRFIAVTSDEGKSLLREAAYGQPQVETAAATIIVCGQLAAHKALAERLQPSIDKGIMPANIAASWATAAQQSHDQNLQLQRDEAIRSASLATMTLIYAAQSLGLASGAMGGFDEQRIRALFPLEDTDLPVMLVTLGYPETGNWAQKARRPLNDVLTVL